MLVGICWCARRPEWPQQLPGGELLLSAQMPQNSMVLMIQCTIGTEHMVECPIKCLYAQYSTFWNQRKACVFTTQAQRCISSPHQPSLPLYTSISLLRLLSSSCTWFSRPYPTPLCSAGPQHPAPGAGMPDVDRGAAERSSAPEQRAGVMYPPPGADRSLHLQPGEPPARLSLCWVIVWELSPALPDACPVLKL